MTDMDTTTGKVSDFLGDKYGELGDMITNISDAGGSGDGSGAIDLGNGTFVDDIESPGGLMQINKRTTEINIGIQVGTTIGKKATDLPNTASQKLG